MNEQTIGSWLGDLAAKTPAPGGGAAAALSAATSAALIGMVTNYTTGKKWADREEEMKRLNQEVAVLRLQALLLIEEDAETFTKVGAAYKLPSESDQQKTVKKAAIQTAVIGAAQPPRKVAELAQKLVPLCNSLIETSNPNVISDIAVAAAMASSALQSAIINIEINQQLIENESVKKSLDEAIHDAANTMSAANMIVELVREKIVKDTP